MKLLAIENGELRLNSFMDELAFGKTNYDSIVTQAGVLAECDECSEGKYHFTFSPWCFSEIKSYNEPERGGPVVFYCGNNPLTENAKTLLEYYEAAGLDSATKEQKDDMFTASYIICSIYTQAAVEKTEIPVNGGSGIFIDLSGEKPKVLFLPPNLFKYSSAGLDSIGSANAHGCWVNPTLLGLPSICFARAVIAYKMLTGRYPYPAANNIDRNADILDRKFLPLELSVNGINLLLATEVNKALKLNSNEVAVPGKKKKGKASEDLTPTETFPLELLYNAKQSAGNSTVSDEVFAEKAKAYLKSQDSKINTKRKIRRNTATIVTVLIVTTIVGILIGSSVKSNLDNYTSKGLTSTQTVEGYFKAVNEKDAVLMGNMTSGRKVKRYVDVVSQVYIIGKSRQAYAHDMGVISPMNYILFATDINKEKQAGIYGVTNVKIDGKLSDLNPTMYKRNQRPKALTEENGISLTDKAQSVHSVEYFSVRSEGEDNEISVEKVYEIFTLSYEKDQWRIVNIETNTFETNFNSIAFKYDYFNTLKQNEGDVYKTCQQLGAKYPWLPSNSALKLEAARLEDQYKELKLLGL